MVRKSSFNLIANIVVRPARPATMQLFLFLIFICTFNGSVTYGQSMGMADAVRRAGLKAIWLNSAGIGSGGEIVDWYLTVNESKLTTYIRIDAGRYAEMISEFDLDAFGKPLGLDGLVEQAEFRKEILQAELASREEDAVVNLTQFTLPKSTIFVLGSNSRLTALDADTGKVDWSTSFGSLRQPNIGLGASDNYLAAINGTTLFCFDVENGKLIWSRNCRYAPVAPPVVTEDKIFVPLLNGRMEVFNIANEGFNSFNVIGVGVPTSRPLITDLTVSWPTRAGHMNVIPAGEKNERFLLYRLRASGMIHNTPVDRDGIIYATSENGFIYAIEETTGVLLWQAVVRSEIYEPPFVFGDSVYAITNNRRLYRFDALTGVQKWDEPVEGIGRYVGSSETKLYLSDGLKTLLVLDPNSGRVISRAESGEIKYVLPNRKTDRLYLASYTGIIHCVHELASPVPYFHKLDYGLPRPSSEDKPTETDKKIDPDDPFGVDPFADDPVRNDGDPFGTVADDDPFG